MQCMEGRTRGFFFEKKIFCGIKNFLNCCALGEKILEKHFRTEYLIFTLTAALGRMCLWKYLVSVGRLLFDESTGKMTVRKSLKELVWMCKNLESLRINVEKANVFLRRRANLKSIWICVCVHISWLKCWLMMSACASLVARKYLCISEK